jgi:hypothetical protein
MVYLLDDDWDNDPMVSKAGTAAFGLYTRCGMWVARHLTDGFVPTEIATSYGTREWVAKLVDVGLWQIREDGFQMPHYLDRNPTAEAQRRRREQYAERQRRWREKQGQKRGSNASHNASSNAAPSPSPKGERGGVGAASRPAPHPYTLDGHGCGNCNLPETHMIHKIRRVS